MSRVDVYRALLKFPDSQKALNRCFSYYYHQQQCQDYKREIKMLLLFCYHSLWIMYLFSLNVDSQLRLELLSACIVKAFYVCMSIFSFKDEI